MSTAVARLACDEPTARRIVATVGDALPGDAACAAFERSAGRWEVEIVFGEEPDRAAIAALVRAAGGEADALTYETIAERDWVRASLEGLTPVRAGRFLVHGRHDRAGVPANVIGIEIEAALAFGTGHHGTTRGCLLALDDILKRRRVRRILDIGTGSGVLAIAAARTARRHVIASDIDPVAVTATHGNARLNAVPGLVDAVRASGCRAGAIRNRGPYDLIFANILLGTLAAMAQPLVSLTASGGHVILSGLLPADGRAALARYRAAGLILTRRISLDGWITLMLRRPSRHRRQK